MMKAEVWAKVKRMKEAEHLSISDIARRVGMDRKTVRQALKGQNLPQRKSRAKRVSKLDLYKDYIAERLKEYPSLKGSVLYEEIKRRGYTGKIRILREYLAEIRPKAKETFLRIETLPAEFAQVDWANCGTVGIGNAVRKLSCFVMALSYSRMIYLEFTLSQRLEEFIRCHIHAFEFFGGVTQKILYDNLKTVVLSRLGSEIKFHPKFYEFAGTYLFEPICCNLARGNEKGKVESGIKYIRSNFLSGKTTVWPHIQKEAILWRDETANTRIHATTRQRPLDRFQQEKPLLKPLPAVFYDASLIRIVKATSQALVHFDGNAYSAPYTLSYKALTLKATDQEVAISHNSKIVAVHKRSYERGLVVEDPKHYEGLLAEKKKAFASKLKDQFLNLGECAKNYLEGLIQAELHLPHHMAQIMECVRLYGKTETLQAIHHALQHKAYGAPYLKNIILQQRAARGLKENLPITIPAKPSWTQLSVEEQDLSLYDDLFDPEQENDPALS